MIPSQMHAVLLKGHGGLEQLEYRDDVAVPAPTAGEVLLRVRAAGVNNTDINLRTGWYSKADAAVAADAGWSGAALSFPRIQGADACGEIVAVGAGVDAGRVGERVLVDPVLRPAGDPSLAAARYFGSDCNGAFADYVAVPAANARRITSRLADAELASFPCAYSAAENMLTRAGVAAGETVLVTGASGGVGSAAVQLARRRGARVLAIASRPKLAAVAALGAEQVLERDAPLVATLGRESLDAVVDVVGGTGFADCLELLRRGGRYAVAGAIAGPRVALDLRTLYLKDLKLLGCTILEPEVFGNLIGYIERGEIRAEVSATYPLAEIAAAQRDFLAKAHVGKIVLVP
ncbi:MAG TPA: alcohol dehydrogenase family protein [Steroidobacteraceae bacterium]|nr:alcohol dehydrogenase family protein [Steroidobacteraceae bacterium]